MLSNKVWTIGKIYESGKDRAGEAVKKVKICFKKRQNSPKIGGIHASFLGRVYVLENDHPGKV